MRLHLSRFVCDTCRAACESRDVPKGWIALQVEAQSFDFCPEHARDVREAVRKRQEQYAPSPCLRSASREGKHYFCTLAHAHDGPCVWNDKPNPFYVE